MKKEILKNLMRALKDYDSEGCKMWTRKAIEDDIDPIETLDALTEAMREIGDGYGRGNFFFRSLLGPGGLWKLACPF